jgi:hypothetical protein
MKIIQLKKKFCHTHPLLLIGVFLFIAPFVHAEVSPYVPLVGLPGLPVTGAKSIPEYINQVYLLVIGIGALAGVLRIAWAGVKYSLSDVVTEKSEAKHDITGVLMGLAILLVPFAVLSTINPDLVNLNVLQNVEKINTDSSATFVDNSSFVCTSPECQSNCRAGGAGTIIQKGGSEVCVSKANTSRPTTALSPVEMGQYLACVRDDKVYDMTLSRCSSTASGIGVLGSCERGGGTYNNGTCAPREVIAVETYHKNVLNEFREKNPDFELSWKNQCGDSNVKSFADGDFITYTCYKE